MSFLNQVTSTLACASRGSFIQLCTLTALWVLPVDHIHHPKCWGHRKLASAHCWNQRPSSEDPKHTRSQEPASMSASVRALGIMHIPKTTKFPPQPRSHSRSLDSHMVKTYLVSPTEYIKDISNLASPNLKVCSSPKSSPPTAFSILSNGGSCPSHPRQSIRIFCLLHIQEICIWPAYHMHAPTITDSLLNYCNGLPLSPCFH